MVMDNPYWISSVKVPDFPVLDKEVKVDIAVVGGGIAGITTAFLLKKAGFKVALVEARKILHGTTGHTTAKVTSQHRLIYNYLIDKFGIEKAMQYAQANQAAVEKIAGLVQEMGIDCDFEWKPAYVYTESESFIKNIEDEVEAAQKVGLPASYDEDAGLPFKVKCAVRFDRQAQIHPLKYLISLVQAIPGEGSHVFEHSRVMGVEGESPYFLPTGSGRINADRFVIATHYPFYDKPGFYFARVYASRSYVLGVKVDGNVPEGMQISADDPVRSFRSCKTDEGEIVLIGGEGHKTGQGGETSIRYDRLKKYAESVYRIKSVDYMWSAQDPMTVDSVPYIGRLTSDNDRIFVATGFGKWGMTNSTAAAMIITDMALGKENPWAEVFDPSRFTVTASMKELIKENINVAGKFIEGKLSLNVDTHGEIAEGEGKIMDVNGVKAAVYKDIDGRIHAHNPACTHMGCQVSWNDAEKTWDCPCHGSRFNLGGEVIEAPAVNKLEKLDISQQDLT